ncbi:MAG: deoxyribodipyrimidine photo-lyase [Deltaproteobacteria bacterium]|nr:deoxyribodipyrimidine photo-lyase [Deltaproteobacteria bacterium]TLN02047.1 MAG: deoxyribodipyrimidine photo-lyase [bacterium]
MKIHPLRTNHRNRIPEAAGAVVYWMSRDQRVADNWALLHAQDLALERQAPLVVVFTLADAFLGATLRHFGFMLRGLAHVAERLRSLGICFILLRGNPPDEICRFLQQHQVGVLVTDFDPLGIKRSWHDQVARSVSVSQIEVDAHNIVPCRIASTKQEYGAYTIRPKIHRLLADFLVDVPPVLEHPFPWRSPVNLFDAETTLSSMPVDRSVAEIGWITPGEKGGRARLDDFIKNGLASYETARKDPCRHGQSGLSPWLHFGQISAQRVALEVSRQVNTEPSREAFLEELIVRRELADNFCLHNSSYDRVEGFPEWAQRTIAEHRHDLREYLYTPEQLETAQTHDPLWNAAQQTMVSTGTMHGYLRMYWAKKILEWSPSPEDAMSTAVMLNDRYQLDGRDPNGYAGIAWSIGGVHDRAWGERPVFGKIRYMNENGCRRKFNVAEYISRHSY